MDNIRKIQKVLVDKDKNVYREFWEQQFLHENTYDTKGITDQNKRILKDLVKELPKGIMLDNGCGKGRVKKFYENIGWEVWGIDISKNALKLVSKTTPINLIHTRSEDLPFKNDFFDVVLSWRVLHSLVKKDRLKAVKEIDRVLKDNGVIICSVQACKDKKTLSKYKRNGMELDEDENTYVVDIILAGKKVQRLKHFYTKNGIIEEIERNSKIKVSEVTLFKEKCGWSDEIQAYWVVKAQK